MSVDTITRVDHTLGSADYLTFIAELLPMNRLHRQTTIELNASLVAAGYEADTSHNRNAVQAAIRTMRASSSVAILSDGKGYWLSTDRAEIVECAQRLQRLALKNLELAHSLLGHV